MDRVYVFVERAEPGTNGGARGDLLVEVYVQPHEEFERHDYDLYSEVKISYPKPYSVAK